MRVKYHLKNWGYSRDFAGDPAMKAIGLFAHAGVANHPGDGGMAAIANAILKTLFPDAFATKEKTRNAAEKKSACAK